MNEMLDAFRYRLFAIPASSTAVMYVLECFAFQLSPNFDDFHGE